MKDFLAFALAERKQDFGGSAGELGVLGLALDFLLLLS